MILHRDVHNRSFSADHQLTTLRNLNAGNGSIGAALPPWLGTRVGWGVFVSKVLIPCMSQWYLSHACIMPLSAALPHSSTKANKEFLQQLHHQLSRIFRRLQGSRVRRLSGLGQGALCGLRPLHAAPMDCPRPAMQGESCKSWQIFEVLIISDIYLSFSTT